MPFLFAQAREGCYGQARLGSAMRFLGSTTRFQGKSKEGTAMAIGKIKWFSDIKGYGFIDTGEDKDLFVHFSAVQQEGYKYLHEGQEVEYEIGEGPKGKQAQNVVP